MIITVSNAKGLGDRVRTYHAMSMPFELNLCRMIFGRFGHSLVPQDLGIRISVKISEIQDQSTCHWRSKFFSSGRYQAMASRGAIRSSRLSVARLPLQLPLH
jgi:hypothetical protein